MEIGDKFGFFEVTNKFIKNNNSYITVKCCCGKEIIETEYLYSYRPIRSCGCQRKNRDSNSGSKCKTFKGVGEMHKGYVINLHNSAKMRGYCFEISMEYMWELFLKQNKQCIFTGEPLFFAAQKQVKKGKIQSASIDRINNDIGYIESNIQWVHKDVNLIRGKMTTQEFLDMVVSIYNFSILKQIPNELVREPVIIGDIVPKYENFLTVIKEFTEGRRKVECQCVCGKTIIKRYEEYYRKGKLWQSCGCKEFEMRSIHSKILHWEGIGEIGKNVLNSIERHARDANRECSITLQFLWDLFLKQDKRCFYTGKRLYFDGDDRTYTASLDRINSNLGYTEENVQWIHRDVNWAKKDLTTERFMELILKIHERWQAGLIPCFSTLKIINLT